MARGRPLTMGRMMWANNLISSNGLFGNPALKGVYYFGPTTTGSLEAGEVVKDYTTGGANG